VITEHKVVGRQEWQAARAELLQREKAHTRMADELARQRRELPWFAIEKEYRFDATGTDVLGYRSESPAVSVFTLQDGIVYQTYAGAARGVEFLMGYYPILDRAPKGRDEGDAFQSWIRRHDEYV
jgi:predicted dithiol-disulfide oxidoreductase (DUF899 family)